MTMGGRVLNAPARVALIGGMLGALTAQAPALQPPELQDPPAPLVEPGFEDLQDPDEGFGDLDLEDLLNLEVTTVRKKAERLVESSAAVFVITQRDLRRSGVTSIPDALRLVPGIHVAQINSSHWAITARGFNGQFANKLLVMIDGRSVYSPIFSGVYWDKQDVLIEDIDRIEVIRGPGGAVWGANAVNGVINIITKPATETQGGLLTAGFGNELRGFGSLRYGTFADEDVAFRVWAKYFRRDGGRAVDDANTPDDWWLQNGGVRIDWTPTSTDTLTLQGDVYRGHGGSRVTVPSLSGSLIESRRESFDYSGGNILGRWTRESEANGTTSVQFFFDSTTRNEDALARVRTFDLEVQHALPTIGSHSVMVGLGYRRVNSRTEGSDRASLTDTDRDLDLFSVFFNDRIELVENELFFTLGAKLEHNPFTGVEFQPDARLLWQAHENHTAWAAISRAVRNPTQISDDGRAWIRTDPGPGGVPVQVVAMGNSSLESEDLTAFDIGYRYHPEDGPSLDLAAFYNDYQDHIVIQPGTASPDAGPPPRIVAPVVFSNAADAQAYGFEAAAQWDVSETWRLAASYAYFRGFLDTNGSDALSVTTLEGGSPRNTATIRSSWTIEEDVDLDLTGMFVDALDAFDVPAYFRLDGRIAWRPTSRSELELVIQNALDDRHFEYGRDVWLDPSRVERAAYVQFSVRF